MRTSVRNICKIKYKVTSYTEYYSAQKVDMRNPQYLLK